jgi:transcriptional regulator with XRE-family HTH domain
MGRTEKPLAAAVEFGTRVRGLRQDRQWSIEHLADDAGLHWTYVGSVERGERNISLRNICRLAKALGIGADDLMKGLERLV